jgi:hypothetical protein
MPGRSIVMRRTPVGCAALAANEARTLATDDPSRCSFVRYWREVSPFVGFIMRSMLRVIEGEARGPVR